MISKILTAFGVAVAMFTTLTVATRSAFGASQSDGNNDNAQGLYNRKVADLEPSNGKFFDVDLSWRMSVTVDDGKRAFDYRISTAHAYSWWTQGYIDGMNLTVGAPHEFYLWPENISVTGHLVSGSLRIPRQTIPITNGVLADAVTSNERPYSAAELMNGYNGVLAILPNLWPPTDGTILSNLDWAGLVQFPSIHLFAVRYHVNPTSSGILRFGGPRPEEHRFLNITTTSDECWTIMPMPPLYPQSLTSYGYTIQMDVITYNGNSIYDSIGKQVAYQIDTTYPFIAVPEVKGLNRILSHFSPPPVLTGDGLVQVNCNATFDGFTEVVFDKTRFLINPIDMVVQNPLRDGRCFSAYQQHLTHGLYKLGIPFLYNVGVTFDFKNQLHNITSRPFYENSG